MPIELIIVIVFALAAAATYCAATILRLQRQKREALQAAMNNLQLAERASSEPTDIQYVAVKPYMPFDEQFLRQISEIHNNPAWQWLVTTMEAEVWRQSVAADDKAHMVGMYAGLKLLCDKMVQLDNAYRKQTEVLGVPSQG